MSKSVRKYSEEFREESVKLALKSTSISQAARELGVPLATLHTWVNQLKSTVVSGLPEGQSVTCLLEENRRLHKELSRVKEEKEILKKAAAYFARESS
jgi:transposase